MVWERAAASTVAVGRAEHAGMGERLVSNERFTAQISACRIIPTAFPRDDAGVSDTAHGPGAAAVHRRRGRQAVGARQHRRD